MLENLFGSRTRVKLLKLFLNSSEKKFFVRELTRLINERINSVRRELLNLEKFGLIKSISEGQKKYYYLDNDFILINELKALFVKSRMLLEKSVISKVEALKGIKYLALTGFFVKDDEQEIDLLIVGNISKVKLDKIIKSLEKNFDQEFRYTYLPTGEFKYRKDITDKFLYNVLNGKKIVVIDKLKYD
jgi:Fe2+ or Zn2+ uptake regulation protein